MNRKILPKKEKFRKKQIERNLERARTNKNAGIVISIAGLFFIVFLGNMWLNRNNEILQSDIKEIEGTVVNKLELKRQRKNGYYMTIKTKEYPNIDFRIGDYGMYALKRYSIQEKVEVGDRIKIDIKKEDYEKLNPSPDGIKKITVYGVRDDEVEYLNVSGYNREFKNDRNSIFAYILLAYSFWMFGIGVRLWIKNKKLVANYTQ